MAEGGFLIKFDGKEAKWSCRRTIFSFFHELYQDDLNNLSTYIPKHFLLLLPLRKI